MAHFTFEEIIADTGIASATLNRRLKTIKEEDATTYTAMLLKEGRVKTYDWAVLKPILSNWKDYLDKLQERTAGEAPPVVKPAPAKKSPPSTVEGPKPKLAGVKAKRVPVDTQKREKLTELLQTPVVVVQPDAETLAMFQKITDPVVKERVELSIQICHEYSSGLYSLPECCQQAGVPVRSFYQWKYKHAEIAVLYKRAKKKARTARAQVIADVSHEALLRLVSGEEYDEVTTMFSNRVKPNGEVVQVPTGSKVTRKRILPSVPATIFALTNLLSRQYQHRNHFQIGPDATQQAKDEIDRMSPEEREQQVLGLLTDQIKQELLSQGWEPPTNNVQS